MDVPEPLLHKRIACRVQYHDARTFLDHFFKEARVMAALAFKPIGNCSVIDFLSNQMLVWFLSALKSHFDLEP